MPTQVTHNPNTQITGHLDLVFGEVGGNIFSKKARKSVTKQWDPRREF